MRGYRFLAEVTFKKIDENILQKHDKLITKTLLYGGDKFDLSCNKSIISSTIEFIASTEKFSNLLVQIFIFKHPFYSHYFLDFRIFLDKYYINHYHT